MLEPFPTYGQLSELRELLTYAEGRFQSGEDIETVLDAKGEATRRRVKISLQGGRGARKKEALKALLDCILTESSRKRIGLSLETPQDSLTFVRCVKLLERMVSNTAPSFVDEDLGDFANLLSLFNSLPELAFSMPYPQPSLASFGLHETSSSQCMFVPNTGQPGNIVSLHAIALPLEPQLGRALIHWCLPPPPGQGTQLPQIVASDSCYAARYLPQPDKSLCSHVYTLTVPDIRLPGPRILTVRVSWEGDARAERTAPFAYHSSMPSSSSAASSPAGGLQDYGPAPSPSSVLAPPLAAASLTSPRAASSSNAMYAAAAAAVAAAAASASQGYPPMGAGTGYRRPAMPTPQASWKQPLAPHSARALPSSGPSPRASKRPRDPAVESAGRRGDPARVPLVGRSMSEHGPDRLDSLLVAASSLASSSQQQQQQLPHPLQSTPPLPLTTTTSTAPSVAQSMPAFSPTSISKRARVEAAPGRYPMPRPPPLASVPSGVLHDLSPGFHVGSPLPVSPCPSCGSTSVWRDGTLAPRCVRCRVQRTDLAVQPQPQPHTADDGEETESEDEEEETLDNGDGDDTEPEGDDEDARHSSAVAAARSAARAAAAAAAARSAAWRSSTVSAGGEAAAAAAAAGSAAPAAGRSDDEAATGEAAAQQEEEEADEEEEEKHKGGDEDDGEGYFDEDEEDDSFLIDEDPDDGSDYEIRKPRRKRRSSRGGRGGRGRRRRTVDRSKLRDPVEEEDVTAESLSEEARSILTSYLNEDSTQATQTYYNENTEMTHLMCSTEPWHKRMDSAVSLTGHVFGRFRVRRTVFKRGQIWLLRATLPHSKARALAEAPIEVIGCKTHIGTGVFQHDLLTSAFLKIKNVVEVVSQSLSRVMISIELRMMDLLGSHFWKTRTGHCFVFFRFGVLATPMVFITTSRIQDVAASRRAIAFGLQVGQVHSSLRDWHKSLGQLSSSSASMQQHQQQQRYGQTGHRAPQQRRSDSDGDSTSGGGTSQDNNSNSNNDDAASDADPAAATAAAAAEAADPAEASTPHAVGSAEDVAQSDPPSPRAGESRNASLRSAATDADASTSNR